MGVWKNYRVNCPTSLVQHKLAGKAVRAALIICLLNAEAFANFIRNRVSKGGAKFDEKTVSVTVMIRKSTVETLTFLLNQLGVEVRSKSQLLTLALDFAINRRNRDFRTLLSSFF